MRVRKIIFSPFITTLIVFVCSCHVMLIGAYDQVTDEGIQKVQNDISQLIVKIQKNIDDKDAAANKYQNLKPEFEEIEGSIKSLTIRCDALPKYTIVKNQITTLQDNVVLMEQLSKAGFTPEVLHIVDSTFGVQFKALITLQNGLKREKQNAQ